MDKTPTPQPATTNDKSAQAPVSGVDTENAIQKAEDRKKGFVSIYGENPTKEKVVEKFLEKHPDYEDKSYEDIMAILKDGVKQKDGTYDTGLQYKNLHKRLSDQEKEQKIKQEKATDDDRKQQEIGKMKEELKIEQPKPQEAKKPETKPAPVAASKPTETKSESKSRWSAEDEANRGGSKSDTEKAPEVKEEKAPKEKAPKTPGHFRKKTGKVLARPFKTLNKVRKTIGRTIAAPTYFLADIGEKKATGGKDLMEGYKKIWTGKKAA